MRVTKLRRDPDDRHWTARVSVDGVTVAIDRRYGSWRVPGADGDAWRECRPAVAAELQERVRRLERRQRRALRPNAAAAAVAAPRA